MMTHTRDIHFTIRPATSKDTALILRFIRELADYEKLLHEVVADEATLKQNLFGEMPHAKVVIGEYNGKPVSFALYFHNFSTFLGRPGIYLEDLYVQPDMRGKGLGKILLGYLASLAVELNCGRLEWWVLDWNKPAIDFYRSLGAQTMDEWTVNRVTDQALGELAKQL
jgi:GNAT superfamily N-acetyltransferase